MANRRLIAPKKSTHHFHPHRSASAPAPSTTRRLYSMPRRTSSSSRLLPLVLLMAATAPSSVAFAATPAVRLWNSGTCPYAQRAWIALLEKEVAFEHRIVDLQDKPQDFSDLYSSIHPDPNARAKVPILEHGEAGVRLIESAVCAEYVAEAFPGQGADLLPASPAARARMRLLGEMWQASGIGNYWPLLQAETEEARAAEAAKLEEGMRIMDKFLVQHGDPEGPFFLGKGDGAYCLGEVCLAPFVQRLLVVLPHWAKIEPLSLADRLSCTRLRRWMEALAARPSTVASGGTKEETIENYGKLLARMKAAKQQAAASK